MSLNPMIPLMARGVQIDDPLEVQAKAYAVQGAQQRNALLGKQMRWAEDERESARADEAATRDFLLSDKSENALRAFMHRPKAFMAERKRMLEEADKSSEISSRNATANETKFKDFQRRLQMFHDFAGGVQDQAGYDRALAMVKPWLTPEAYANLPTVFSPELPKKMQSFALTTVQRLEDETKRRGQDLSAQAQINAAIAGANNRASDQNFARSDKLRDEFQAGSKEFVKVRDAFVRIQKAASDPSAAGDLALIFNYMKMLDPGSVVREGEFATAQNAAGVPDQIRNLYNRAKSGERLNPQQRKDFIAQAQRQYEGALEGHTQFEDQYRGYSRSFGVSPDNVVTDYRPRQAGPRIPQIKSDADYSRLPSGAEYIAPDGSRRVKR